jgi:hypothetical protein
VQKRWQAAGNEDDYHEEKRSAETFSRLQKLNDSAQG